VNASDAPGSVQCIDAVHAVTFQRPAEIVDISERIYRQVFAVGLWVAAGFTAFAMVASLLQPPGSQLTGVVVCGFCLAAVVGAALRPAPLYRGLRRHPWTLLVPGVVLGAGADAAGPHNLQLFLPIIAVIGVIGIATPRHVVAVSGLIAAAGLGAPQVMDGRGDLAGAIVVVVPPIMFWLIVDHIAGFALRLHQSLNRTPDAAAQQPYHDSGQGLHPRDPSAQRSSADKAEPRGLPQPHVITVDGIRLTSRQLQVVLLSCEGLEHKEMAACLDIGVAQVRRHLEKARQRTASRSEPQLAAWARRTGLVPRPSRPGADAR
jgi:DNA-binding CsgD family transcriptional regulator